MRDDLKRTGANPRFHERIALQIGAKQFADYFGAPTTLEGDLLTIGAATLAADRATKRGEREDYQDRLIELTIPVTNIGRLQPLAATLEEILEELSRDGWRVEFKQASGRRVPEAPSPPHGRGRTLLFSGGLDSLAASLRFDTPELPLLVSHITHNRSTANAQERLIRLLNRRPGPKAKHYQFFVSSSGQDHSVEESQRTRSFLFLVLAALVAARTDHTEIVYIAENGQMAIHLPLSQARIGAFSTRTAHPDVLPLMQRFLQQALCRPVTVTNPFAYLTKAEVVRIVRNRLPRAIALTVSCWRTTYLPQRATHCGACVPCYVRRIALEYEGSDPTRYAEDPWQHSMRDLTLGADGRRNLADLAEFVVRTEQSPNVEMVIQWPELGSDHIDKDEAIGMYKRFAAEARAVLSRYPAGTFLA